MILLSADYVMSYGKGLIFKINRKNIFSVFYRILSKRLPFFAYLSCFVKNHFWPKPIFIDQLFSGLKFFLPKIVSNFFSTKIFLLKYFFQTLLPKYFFRKIIERLTKLLQWIKLPGVIVYLASFNMRIEGFMLFCMVWKKEQHLWYFGFWAVLFVIL